MYIIKQLELLLLGSTGGCIELKKSWQIILFRLVHNKESKKINKSGQHSISLIFILST